MDNKYRTQFNQIKKERREKKRCENVLLQAKKLFLYLKNLLKVGVQFEYTTQLFKMIKTRH